MPGEQKMTDHEPPLRVPYIDESVEHVGITKLRAMNCAALRSLRTTLVIRDGDEPLAVLIEYGAFLAMQRELMRLSKELALRPVVEPKAGE